MRTSVRRTTASPQTTIGTTRTTCSSPSTTPMTALTQCTCTSTDAWRTCTEDCTHLCSTAHDDTAHLMAQVLSAFIVIHGHIHGRTSLTRFSAFYFYLFLLSVTVFLFHLELFSDLLHTKCMANLRCSTAEESEDTLNAFTSPTGYEPKLLAFDELNDSSVPLSFKIPIADQDVDDLTLGKLLTEAHRGQVDYCVPGGMSVSQSSSSVMFDGSEQLDGERMVDQSGKSGVTRKVISSHSNFSEDIQTVRVVHRSGQLDERNSSNAQIRTLLEEQRVTIIAEYREKVSHHELQAAHAEEERRLLQGQLWRQKLELREARQQSLTEMEELWKFQSSTFDTIARRKLIEDQNTIMELSGRIQELQNEVNCMNNSTDCQDAEPVRSGNSHVTSRLVSFPLHPPFEGLLRPSFISQRQTEEPPNTWDTSGISGNVFCKSTCIFISSLSSRIESMGDNH